MTWQNKAESFNRNILFFILVRCHKKVNVQKGQKIAPPGGRREGGHFGHFSKSPTCHVNPKCHGAHYWCCGGSWGCHGAWWWCWGLPPHDGHFLCHGVKVRDVMSQLVTPHPKTPIWGTPLFWGFRGGCYLLIKDWLSVLFGQFLSKTAGFVQKKREKCPEFFAKMPIFDPPPFFDMFLKNVILWCF